MNIVFVISSIIFILSYFIAADPADEKPLFVTKLLNSGSNTAHIQELASVSLFNKTHQSYSGFFTVHESCNSNLFFWFFKSPINSSEKPVVLWLQGGPGNTFITTLFGGNGPYRFENETLIASDISWTKDFNILYIENPVGTGFAFTDYWSCYSKTVQHAADNLYEALRQFYLIFPAYKSNAFFLAGESYAGKYISVIANVISGHNQNKTLHKINLKGLFIGGGFMDPENQIYYADPLYEYKVINKTDRDIIKDQETKLRKNIKDGHFLKATTRLSWIASIIYTSGHWPPIDILNPKLDYSIYRQIRKYIGMKQVRKAIHVGSLKFYDRRTWIVVWHFRKDFFNSVSRYLSKAIGQYKVMLYSGQYDMLIPPVQIDHVISALEWADLPDFQNTTRQPWYIDGKLVAYKKTFKNLSQVEVQKANHFIVRSQPKVVAELFRSFVESTF